MIVKYINKKKKSHYLKASLTKNGQKRYYIVKDRKKYLDSQLLSDIPSGYEFYELPEDARVVLRKRLETIITEEEVQIIKEVMDNHPRVKDFIVDKNEDSVFVYLAKLKIEEWVWDPELFLQVQSYRPLLKFLKNKNGSYEGQRFCHMSRNYGWITMETGNNLYSLAKKYCAHIDQESLLDFWIEGEEDF